MDDLLHPKIEELTSAEIAARIGKDRRTVQRWLKSGTLPAQPLASNRYAVSTVDLEHFTRPEHASESSAIVLDSMAY